MFTELVREIEHAKLRARFKAGQHHSGPGHRQQEHTRSRSRGCINQQHQQRPSTGRSRSRSCRVPPPLSLTQAGLLTEGGGSSAQSGSRMAMHMIGAGTGAGVSGTRGYSTNVTPPATAASTSEGQLGGGSVRSSRGKLTRGPVANMGVDGEVKGRCCTIM
jgi:hypothetical protein